MERLKLLTISVIDLTNYVENKTSTTRLQSRSLYPAPGETSDVD